MFYTGTEGAAPKHKHHKPPTATYIQSHKQHSMASIEEKINSITASQADSNEKTNQYTSLLESIPCTWENRDVLYHFVETLLGITYGRATIKPVLLKAVEYLQKNRQNAEVETYVLTRYLESLQPLIISFEEAEMAVRQRLADLYQEQEDYNMAAKLLQEGLNSSDRRLLTDDIRFETLVKIVRNYLETGQPELAELPLSRAAIVRPKVVKMDPLTDIHFKLSQARILDTNRKFLDASTKYHLISREDAVDEDDRMVCLSQAIICCVLSPAGPTRSAALRRLHNDERSSQLPQFGILEKVFGDRILLPDDVEEFSKHLQPHHTASMADGVTVLSKAVIEHNVLSVSKIYSNIGIPELGKFLGLEASKAEEYTAKMIAQNRLAGKIDQPDGLIYFKSNLDSETSQGNSYDYANSTLDGNGTVLLKQRDQNIHDLCMNLEDIVTAIQNIKA